MEKTVVRQLVRDPGRYVDKEVEISGWLRSNRSEIIWVPVPQRWDPFQYSTGRLRKGFTENFEEIARYRVGSAVTVRGILVETPDARQPFEIKAREIVLEGEAPEDYPIQPKRHTREFLREAAHLRPRTNLFSGSVPRSVPSRLCGAPVLPGKRFCLCAYTDYYCQ